ncbi:MAG: HK97 gp10 family phage protein [Desulfobulbaceae bacterium]|nr:HK97 gp10 family phage protein [Desulfobulbaceae bacterium]
MKMSMKPSAATADLLKKLGDLLSVGELNYAAGIGADIVAEEARRLAPGGPTGNLRRGIVSRIDNVKVLFGSGGKAGHAYVGINYNIAPHAHLVEFGTAGARTPTKKKYLKMVIDGQVIFRRVAGPMPAKPFLRPAIDAKSPEAAAAVAADLAARIALKVGS